MTGSASAVGEELRRATASSGTAAFGARTAQALASLGVALVMARLLTPGDFGLFAMVMPLGAFGMIAANHCVQTAVLQHPQITDDDLDRFHRFASRVASLAAAVIGALGFALAAFYRDARIPPMALALGAIVVLMPRAALQEARLKRALRFPLVHAVQSATLALGLLTGVVAAWRGLGYWALPLQVITMELARMVAIDVVSDWRPRPRGTAADPATVALRRAWRAIFAQRIGAWCNEQPDLAAVGRLGGSVVLGNYGTARRWAWYAFDEPFLALTEVVIVGAGRERHDAPRFRRLVSRFVLAVLALTLPPIAFLVVEAEAVVRVLLGTQWLDAVPFLRILGVSVFAATISRASTWIPLALGDNARLVRWAFTRQLPATVVAVAAGIAWGAHGVAVAMAALATILVLPTVRHMVHGTGVRAEEVFRAAARPAGASVAAAVVVAASDPLLDGLAPAARLVAGLALFALALGAAWLALPGGVRDTRELLTTARSLLPRRDAP